MSLSLGKMKWLIVRYSSCFLISLANNQNLLIQLVSCQFILVREDISHTFVVKSKLKNAANASKDSDATI